MRALGHASWIALLVGACSGSPQRERLETRKDAALPVNYPLRYEPQDHGLGRWHNDGERALSFEFRKSKDPALSTWEPSFVLCPHSSLGGITSQYLITMIDSACGMSR